MAKLDSTTVYGKLTVTSVIHGYNIRTINAQTGTTYTADADDKGVLITLTNASAITFTLPPDVFEVGDWFEIVCGGAGDVTVSEGTGVTLNSADSYDTLSTQYKAASFICTASNTFLGIGLES